MIFRTTVSGGLRVRPATPVLGTSNNKAAVLPAAAAASPRHPKLANDQSPVPGRQPYATSPDSRRRSVTPFNDDGRVPWTELSAAGKTARAVQQTFNFGLVVGGLVLTGGVGYFLYSEVFSPDSKTAHFNRAVDRIRADPRLIELLGEGKKIEAFGEETWNKWQRARPIASTVTIDAQGTEHMMIQFNVRGPKGFGRASVHLIKRTDQVDHEYKYFYVDVKGHQRIWLENADAARAKPGERKPWRLFGVNWS